MKTSIHAALPLVLGSLVWPVTAGAAPISLHIANVAEPERQIRTVAYSRMVLTTQQWLNQRGYDAGPEDGLMGAKTRSAIIAYQRDNGLAVTGRSSVELNDHIQGNKDARGPGRSPEDPEIERLQKRLERLGYNVEVNGRLDSQTQAAIRAYQRDHDLFVTGTPGEYLQAHVQNTLRERRAERRAERRDEDRNDRAVTRQTIADIEEGLQARGYRVDRIDGEMDEQTTAAIRAYQRDSGREVTGEASVELANALQVGLEDSYEATTEDIRIVQQRLNRLGYDAGPADGVMGPSTRKAIRDYQAASNLNVTGTVNRRLLASLDAEAETTTTAGARTPRSGYAIRMSDDFSDGNFQSNPRWQVVADQFAVQDGVLTSRVDVRAPESGEELGKSVLQGVLGQVLGVRVGQGSGAAIAQSTDFGDSFQIEAKVSGSPLGAARFGIGPYRGTNVSHGYRLIYDTERPRPLALVAITDNGTRTVASAQSQVNLADGNWHDIVWTRDSAGMMTVSVNGTTQIQVRDQSFSGANDGFSVVNLGGSWKVDSVTVASAAR